MTTARAIPNISIESFAKEFEEFAYSVSHDLSAPARAMIEFSKLLAENPAFEADHENGEYLALIIENGRKLQAMMDGLLVYSRLNTLAKPYSHFNCSKLVHNILEAEFSEYDCTVEMPDPAIVHGDIEQIRQLFTVLLDNALKFCPEGSTPQVRIYAKPGPQGWQFAICDNGIGISPQFHERIFKLFQRLHTDEEYPGIGIGLTIARKIIHRHGGRIWCESPGSGKGITFYFTLPYPVPSHFNGDAA